MYSKDVLERNPHLAKSAPVKPQGKRRGSGPEQAIQTSILAYLHARGILAWRINSGAVKAAHGGLIKLAPAGHPDIAGVYQGRALYIEVKAPKGKVSSDQQAFIDAVTRAGAIAFVAHSIEDVRYQLEYDRQPLPTDPLVFCRWLKQQINAPEHWQDWPDPQLDSAMRIRRLDTHEVLRRLDAVLAAAKEQRP